MPIDPNISLQGKPVQFDSAGILNMFQQGQALRMQRQLQGQQMQLNDQRIEEGKAAVQKSQIAARDQQTIQGLYLKNNGDPDATVRDAIQAGASTDAVQGLQQHAANIREKNAKADADELGVKKYHNEQMLGLHKTAIDLANSDPQAYAQAWPELYQQAVKLDPSARQHLDPNNPPTVQQLSLSQAAYGTDEYLRKEEEAKRQQQAEVRAQAGEQRAAKLAVPQLDEANAKAAAANRQQDATLLSEALRQSPDALRAQLAKLSPDRRQPFLGITSQSTPDDILKIGLTPDQEVTTAQTAAHNAATEANEKRLREIAAGNLGVAQGRLKIEQDTHNQTYGPNANPALVGVEPHLRLPAAAGAQKITDEYGKAMDSAANMQTFLDAAKAGNKMAGSNLPIMGAESLQALNGIKRINRTEIEAYQGAGSLLDRIQGKIGKLTSGQPIPQDVINDIEALQSKLAGNATASANQKMDAHNGIYRSNFKLTPRGNQPAAAPNSGAPADVKKALSSAGPGIHTLSDGSKWMTAADGTITKQ